MNQKLSKFLLILGLPISIALCFRFLFGSSWNDIWSVMTVSFLAGLPYLVGVITIYFSKEENIKSLGYRIITPWIPIFAFFIITLVFSLEGWACWIMILPLFMFFASLGGVTCGYFRLRKLKRSSKLQISLAFLLPILIGPIEHEFASSRSLSQAYTSIEINATPEAIWKNVTRVSVISDKEQNRSINSFLGIPEPRKAELNYEGIGAVREASFSGGLIFTEIVTSYEHEQFMEFTIEPNTGEIPSTTFDEHVLIGGEYFDVLKGTYKLKQISPSTFELQLWSEFELNTSFNWYSEFWARLIMKDIQNNILKVIKKRAEKKILTNADE
ncbi:hypothetical protein [Marivirga harenae]|uniref:hypothetical protein n=1 Tax=Marivirga harenae TaxID=2010992 RepID=UPI0026DF8BA6|nr:hypothetical protein [Marivirga harenae]WKV14034.1 hypothetical protein Q3Y49_09365 [Marivirga harenae]